VRCHGSEPPQELKADCKIRQRGQAGDTTTYPTYDGALTGEEVKVACAIAEKKGLIRVRPSAGFACLRLETKARSMAPY
jgi:hypothetical protein